MNYVSLDVLREMGSKDFGFLLEGRGNALWNNLAFVCFQEEAEFIKILTLT